jgi:pimeloyl-ACP methyl ester carboxylesterase
MPVLTRPDGEIHYEVFGEGYPVLLFAPGGLRSRMENWHQSPGGSPKPFSDWTRTLPAAGFATIAMDQRNAGQSRTDIRADHGWHTYTADHLALMDALGFDKFHLLGGCIGGSFCLKVAQTAPERVTAAVLQNPIGLSTENPNYFPDSLVVWGHEHRAIRPELDEGAIVAFGHNMWDQDFVFSVDRDFARGCKVPCLLLPGSDIPHPAATSAELAALLPNLEVLTDWRGPQYLAQQEAAVLGFLKQHTPPK